MNNTIQNERKLVRNIDNIIRNYIRVDEELLKNLSEDDIDRFKEMIGSKSSDKFLDNIVQDGEYDNFTTRLFERLKQENEEQINLMIEEQKQKVDFQKVKGKRMKKPKKVKSLKSRKRNPMKWTNKESNLIKRMIKSNLKSGLIIKELNKQRNNQDMISRTNSSVYGKIHRIKKEEEREEKE